MFFTCVWINGWVNNREACDLRRYRAHYDVIVMTTIDLKQNGIVELPVTWDVIILKLRRCKAHIFFPVCFDVRVYRWRSARLSYIQWIFNEIVTDCTRSCQNENYRCSLWLTSHQFFNRWWVSRQNCDSFIPVHIGVKVELYISSSKYFNGIVHSPEVHTLHNNHTQWPDSHKSTGVNKCVLIKGFDHNGRRLTR